jgi:hypothetical protein
VYHVLNRGNDRQTLFFGSADYEAFVRVVQEALLIASDADTRVRSDALRSVGRAHRPAHWTRSHTPLTWTTAAEEFIAGTRSFT